MQKVSEINKIVHIILPYPQTIKTPKKYKKLEYVNILLFDCHICRCYNIKKTFFRHMTLRASYNCEIFFLAPAGGRRTVPIYHKITKLRDTAQGDRDVVCR